MLPYYGTTGKWAQYSNEILIEFYTANGGGNYIDVGANIGLTTIPVAQNKDVACLAIEPEPRNFRYLRENVSVNCSHDNVTLKNAAAFSKRCTLNLGLSPDNLGDHRIRMDAVAREASEVGRVTVEVDAVPLDELVQFDNRPLAIKIDTQGAEPHVIAGGRRTLQRAQLLLIELWPYGIAQASGEVDEILTLLDQHFAVVSIYRDNDPRQAPMPITVVRDVIREMFHANVSDPDFYVDLIARK
jgi:FkbM family methyltransferase